MGFGFLPFLAFSTAEIREIGISGLAEGARADRGLREGSGLGQAGLDLIPDVSLTMRPWTAFRSFFQFLAP